MIIYILGYIVHTSIKKLNSQYLCLDMLVQSSHKDPVYLDQRIELFLIQYRQQLVEMTTEEYDNYVHAGILTCYLSVYTLIYKLDIEYVYIDVVLI